MYLTGATNSSFPAITVLNTTTASVPSFVDGGRIVSCAIRWFYIGAATDAGGVVQVIPLSSADEVVDNTLHAYADYSTNTAAYTDLREPGTYIFQPTGNVDNNFVALGSDAPSTNPYWGPVLLRINGAASTSVLQVEYVFNYEGTVDAISGIQLGTVKAPRPELSDMRRMVRGGYLHGSEEAVTKKMEQSAHQVTKDVVLGGVSLAGNLLFPGAGSLASLIAGSIW